MKLKFTSYKTKLNQFFINDEDNKLVCKICGKKCKNFRHLGHHVAVIHKIPTQDYYDNYFKKVGDGICLRCGKQTRYSGISNGYSKTCGNYCANKLFVAPAIKRKWENITEEEKQEIVNKNKETKMKNHGDPNYVNYEKAKQTLKERYGDEKYNNMEQHKQTCLERYGKDNYFKTEEFQIKAKKTCLEKYGDDNYRNIEKFKETCNKNLGVDYPMQSKEVQETRNENNLEKYGFKHYTQTDECKEKTKKTCLEKYGVEYPFQLNEFKDKANQTKLEKYGDENYNNRDKMYKTMEELGYWKPQEMLTEFQKYHREVWKETRKWVKELFENWNGLDFYTGEKLLSKEEFKKLNPHLHANKNCLAPSIDHRISVVYGFINKIDPKIIGNIQNLCICSRSSNSIKGAKCYFPKKI